MEKISQLLRWHRSITLHDQDGKDIMQGDKPVKVYIRILGDSDLQDAYRISRVKSAQRRNEVRDKNSEWYKDQVEPLSEADADACRQIIVSARSTSISGDALAIVVREDLPKAEEFSSDPDAMTLEEQEKFDLAVATQNEDYRNRVDEYIKNRVSALEAELKETTLADLREIAKAEIAQILALSAFIDELNDQKAWRSVYTNPTLTERGFSDVEDFRNSNAAIKEQIKQAYAELEVDPDKVKN